MRKRQRTCSRQGQAARLTRPETRNGNEPQFGDWRWRESEESHWMWTLWNRWWRMTGPRAGENGPYGLTPTKTRKTRIIGVSVWKTVKWSARYLKHDQRNHREQRQFLSRKPSCIKQRKRWKTDTSLIVHVVWKISFPYQSDRWQNPVSISLKGCSKQAWFTVHTRVVRENVAQLHLWFERSKINCFERWTWDLGKQYCLRVVQRLLIQLFLVDAGAEGGGEGGEGGELIENGANHVETASANIHRSTLMIICSPLASGSLAYFPGAESPSTLLPFSFPSWLLPLIANFQLESQRISRCVFQGNLGAAAPVAENMQPATLARNLFSNNQTFASDPVIDPSRWDKIPGYIQHQTVVWRW